MRKNCYTTTSAQSMTCGGKTPVCSNLYHLHTLYPPYTRIWETKGWTLLHPRKSATATQSTSTFFDRVPDLSVNKNFNSEEGISCVKKAN